MPELEDLLRDELRTRADAYEPRTDVPARVATGIRRRERRRRAAAVLAAAAALAVVVGVGRVATDDRVEMENPPAVSTTPPPAPTTTAPDSTTTSTTSSTVPSSDPTTPSGPPPTTTADTAPTDTTATPEETADAGEPGPNLGPDPRDRLSLQGWGPILAGDTLRTTQDLHALDLVVDRAAFERSGRTCVVAHSPGQEQNVFLARSADGSALGDPLDAAIVSIGGPGALTETGIEAGMSVALLREVHGEPTSVVPVAGGQLHIHAWQGFAYAFVVSEDTVRAVYSGYIDSADDIGPCA